jgi:hypothetical protein
MSDQEKALVEKLGKRAPKDIAAVIKKIVALGVVHWEKETVDAHEAARTAPEGEREAYMQLYYEAFRNWHRLRQDASMLDAELASKALRGDLTLENV